MRHNNTEEESPLLSGEVVFDDDLPSFTNASLHIYLEDTTLADSSAKVVLHQVMENVADTMQNGRIPFAIHGTILDPQAYYTVRVLIDMNGDGKISRGDYINSISYPVLTRGYPDRVVVKVRKVR